MCGSQELLRIRTVGRFGPKLKAQGSPSWYGWSVNGIATCLMSREYSLIEPGQVSGLPVKLLRIVHDIETRA